MELTWGEDFSILTEVAKSVFARCSPLTDRATTIDYKNHVQQFRDLDWLQLGDPAGLSSDSAALGSIAGIFVEMGRALVDTPLLDLTMSRDASIVIGTAKAVSLASRIGNGAASVMPVFPLSGWGRPLEIRNDVLSGTAMPVSFADQADGYLVLADDGGESALLLIDKTDAVRIESLPNIGEYPMFSVSFSNVAVTEEVVLARGLDADRAVEIAQQRSAVLRAAQVYGAGSRLLDITVRYAQDRHQFGGPIGRFQAVQYLCTDIAINVHLTSAYARSAALAIDSGSDPQLDVALMSKQASRTAQVMVHAAHEVHAGIGYMVESNVHLFTKAAKRWQFDFGSDEVHDHTISTVLDRAYSGEIS
ncbi:hypothetical protein B2J88_13065 [Rhodococcus sp. SRB_17]|nr:hypothetical protein [Rhodococcus sp. SRB_17]